MLRNAFDGVATESTLRRLIASLNFARDSGDRLRVVNDGGSVNTNGSYNSLYHGQNNNAYAPPNSTGSPNSVDAREALRQQYRANFITVRQNRWTF